MMDESGNSNGNFQLADLLGVDFAGDFSGRINYLGDEKILADNRAVLVNAHPGTKVSAYLSFPDFPVRDPDFYASIHSDPPSAKVSGFPGLTENIYGKGKCVYLASPFLAKRQYTQKEFGKKLFAGYLPQMVKEARNLPASAEVTVLQSSDGGKFILCIVNYQDELPPVPLHEVELTIELPEKITSVIRVLDGSLPLYELDGNVLKLKIPEIHSGEFYILE